MRRRGHDGRLVTHIAYSNQRGLPEVFNARISAPDGGELLIFMHDDVWIDDPFLADRVIEGLKTYDVIGAAGNRRRVPFQPAWSFVDRKMTWDENFNLSGAVAHGAYPFGPISNYGAAPAECELLDGAFLAASKSALTGNRLLFDPRFKFNFYDMDFCRNARERGLRLGTWPIHLTHQNRGAFGAPKWTEEYRVYLEKWGT